MQLRRATPEDVPAIMALERQAPTAAHWSQTQYEDLFSGGNRGAQSERLAWVAEDVSKFHAPEFPASDKTSGILAFLIAHRCFDRWELENIAVMEKARCRGLGTLLVHKLIESGRVLKATSIVLEVRRSNLGARSLYQKVGFQEGGCRKNYYERPVEDAILYSFTF